MPSRGTRTVAVATGCCQHIHPGNFTPPFPQVASRYHPQPPPPPEVPPPPEPPLLLGGVLLDCMLLESEELMCEENEPTLWKEPTYQPGR
ncbi:MAG: hypothetical protein KBH07_07695 [Flavobacteriales bacterium]|nr:hypothetical protein [Flavobacteriales bacterium]MBP9081307.1 hypothetical protein [Flavobacteriales bacterium]